MGNRSVCLELKEGKWGREGGVWYKMRLEFCGSGGGFGFCFEYNGSLLKGLVIVNRKVYKGFCGV